MVFALVGVALVPLAVSQSPATDWIGQISLASRVAQTAKEFLVGPYAPLGIVFAPLATLLACGGLIRLWRLDHSRRQPLLDVCTVGFLSLALPALLAVTGIDDVFDPRNSLAGWIPWAIVLAAGLATARAPRVGAMLGAGLCAISALVIAGTEFLPAYQRDDWRDAAHSLSAPPPGGRIVVSAQYGSSPLSVYLPGLRELPKNQATFAAREIDFVYLRTAHAGRSSPGEDSVFPAIAPSAPTNPPSPFRKASTHRTAAYATYRFIAPTAQPVAASLLRRESGDPLADLSLQPRST